MPYRPSGYIGVREAVLRLAEALHPDADVRAYVAEPWPSSGVRRYPEEPVDPYEEPRDTKEDPAWRALERARHEVQQAAGDGVLPLFWRTPRSFDVRPIPAELWRPLAFADALRTERQGGFREWQAYRTEWNYLGYLVREVDFQTWLSDQVAPATDTDDVSWATQWAEDYLTSKKRRPSYEEGIAQLREKRRLPDRSARRVWAQVPKNLRLARGRKH
jgi:hypothetical protein